MSLGWIAGSTEPNLGANLGSPLELGFLEGDLGVLAEPLAPTQLRDRP